MIWILWALILSSTIGVVWTIKYDYARRIREARKVDRNSGDTLSEELIGFTTFNNVNHFSRTATMVTSANSATHATTAIISMNISTHSVCMAYACCRLLSLWELNYCQYCHGIRWGKFGLAHIQRAASSS